MQFSKWITLGFGALCLIAVATVLRAGHLFYMAAILLSLPVVSYCLGWYSVKGLTITRVLPATTWEGETAEITYVVHNNSRSPRFFLYIKERWPAWIDTGDGEPPLFNLGGEDTTTISLPVRFHSRGVYAPRSFNIVALDPLGVFAFTRTIPCDQELVVYPSPEGGVPLPEGGAERFGWQAFVTSALRGSSVEPDGVRDYAPGDPLKRIHWRQTARTGRLNVIEFCETVAVNVIVVIDAQAGSARGAASSTTLDQCARIAAAVLMEASRQGAAVRVVAGDGSDQEHPYTDSGIGKGEESLLSAMDTLARLQSNAPLSPSQLLREAVGPLARGTSLLVLTSVLDRELPGTIARYAGTAVQSVVVYVDTPQGDSLESTAFLKSVAGVGASAYIQVT